MARAPASIVVGAADDGGSLGDAGQLVRIVVGVADLALAWDAHRRAAAGSIVSVGHGAERRRFRQKPVEAIVRERNRPADRVHDLGDSVAGVVRLTGRGAVVVRDELASVEFIVRGGRGLSLSV